MPETEDLYEMLQVHPSAHSDVILAAYRRLTLLYHQDRNPSEEAARIMVQLNRAYEVLGNSESRSEYDRNKATQENTISTRPRNEPADDHGPAGRPKRRTRQTNFEYITIGSHKNDIIRVQGQPDSTRLDESTGMESWYYNDVGVLYINRSGRVQEWSNFGNGLKIELVPGPNVTTSSFFTIDSHKDDVARLQRTPHRIDIEWGFEFRNERDLTGRSFQIRETWHFSGGTVEFSISTGRVTAWDNKDGSLKAQRQWPEYEAGLTGTNFFATGSGKPEVIKIQGKPISTEKWIEGSERWDYGNRNEVEFKSGRVQAWTNIDGSLKVRLVPDPNATTSRLFSLGSHKDDVARLQKTPPLSIHISRTADRETWLFSGGSVDFSISSGRVIFYENIDGSLKCQGIRPAISRDVALERVRRTASEERDKDATRFGIGCVGTLVLGFAILVMLR